MLTVYIEIYCLY